MKPTLVASTLACLLALAGCAPQADSRRAAADNNTTPPANSSASPAVAAASPAGVEVSGANDSADLPEANDAEGFLRRGVEAYKKNRDAEAVAAFEQAVRLEPDLAEAHYRLGLAYAVTGRKDEAKKSYETAVKAYKKTLQRDSKNERAHYHLGLVYGKLFKPDEAVKELKEAARLNSDDYNIYYELGLAHTKLAQYKEAVDALNKALELNPDDFRATDLLEKAQAGKQRRDAFLKQQEKEDNRGGGRSRKVRNVPYYENANRSPTPQPR